ncbi:MAG: hypothetical protein HC836_46615 [Richelia sp. RM2_1_2]|nr:hypothetical protein [Richelia sp. RM2_1_2]
MIKTIQYCYEYYSRFYIPYDEAGILIIICKTKKGYSRLKITENSVFMSTLKWEHNESCGGFSERERFFQSPLETDLGIALYDQN